MARAIIGVRGGAGAKSRLASVLSPAERAELILVMLEDMLDALGRASRVSAVSVATPTPEVAALARARGCAVIRQAQPDGLNRAFDQALAEVAEAAPYEPVVLLPGDLPSIEPTELDALISLAETHALAIAPALDGGTGALVLRAGTQFAPTFGVDSFRRHREQAFQRGLATAVVKAGSLAHDLDRPEDIQSHVGRAGRTGAFLSARQGCHE